MLNFTYIFFPITVHIWSRSHFNLLMCYLNKFHKCKCTNIKHISQVILFKFKLFFVILLIMELNKNEPKLSKWDSRYVELSKVISTWSKDPNRQTGAVIVGQDNMEKSFGYNGLPIGADDTVTSRYEKPNKYMWLEHAERNAIYKAGRNGVSLKDCKMYVTYFPCAECARAIIQSGIRKLYAPQPNFEHPKWGVSWGISKNMLYECGVELIIF